MTTLREYRLACRYPAILDEEKVQKAMEEYKQELQLPHQIVRLQSPWQNYPPLASVVREIYRRFRLDVEKLQCDTIKEVRARAIYEKDILQRSAPRDIYGRDVPRNGRRLTDDHGNRVTRDDRQFELAQKARAIRTCMGKHARIARDLRVNLNWWINNSPFHRKHFYPFDSLLPFGDWMVFSESGNKSIIKGDWDLSRLSTILFGCDPNTPGYRWSRPLIYAFLFGAWYLFWTDSDLYWVAKPTLRLDSLNRLHCTDGPAFLSDVVNFYYLEGWQMPPHIILHPEMLSLQEILEETNEEVRRILVERFGWERFLKESGSLCINHRRNDRDAQEEKLYQLPDSSKRLMVRDPSTGRKYFLGVPGDVATCEQAQLWMSQGLDRRAIHRS